MMLKTRRISRFRLAAVMLAVVSLFAPAQPVAANNGASFVDTIGFRVQDPCTGEIVRLDGEAHVATRTRFPPGLDGVALHTVHFNWHNISAYGETTGAEYIASGTRNDQWEFSGGIPNEQQLTLTMRLEAADGSHSFSYHLVRDIVYDENGNVVSLTIRVRNVVCNES